MVTLDHYLVLGVSRTALAQEIRSAYRRRAFERHPDRGGADRTPEFQQLADAYHVLVDPERRAAYDAELRRSEARTRGPMIDLQRRPPPAPAAEPLVPSRRSGDLRDLQDEAQDSLEEMLSRLLRRVADGDMANRRRGEAIEIGLELTEEEASRGAVVVVLVPALVVCRACEGTGTDGWNPCPVCTLAQDVPVAVRVPARVEDGTILAIHLEPDGTASRVLRASVRIAAG